MVGTETSTLSAPMGLRAKAKAEVFQRIQEAAAELFFAQDYDDVTTKAIAKRADIGEATLFRYVESKSELLATVYGDELEKLVDTLERADDVLAEEPLTAELVLQRIHNFYRGRSQFYLIHPENAARYLRQSYDVGSEGRLHAIEQGDRLVRRIGQILHEAQTQKIVGTEVDVSIVALNCHGIFLHEVNRGSTRGFAPETIYERVVVRINAQLLPLITQNNEAKGES